MRSVLRCAEYGVITLPKCCFLGSGFDTQKKLVRFDVSHTRGCNDMAGWACAFEDGWRTTLDD